VLSYGRAGADLKLVSAEPVPQGQKLVLEVLGISRTLVLPLAGTFQAANMLAALGLAIGSGVPAFAALDAVALLEETVPHGATPMANVSACRSSVAVLPGRI
jgi:UDP-N-acetylmuramoyl-L-alanyl-D-glutamate--2,6-diaminopimelate ligase